MIFDLPSNLILRRAGPANWLAFIITCWGITTLAMGFVQSWQMLTLTRAFLGIFEVLLTECSLKLGGVLSGLHLFDQLLVQTI